MKIKSCVLARLTAYEKSLRLEKPNKRKKIASQGPKETENKEDRLDEQRKTSVERDLH